MDPIENLIFAGGGIKCLSFIGALEILEANKCLDKLTRVIGSSAGALVATLVACKFDSREIYNLINFNFTDLLDNSNIMKNIWRLIFSYGYYDNEALLQVIAEALKSKGICESITFKQVWDLFKIELVITGTCLNKRKTEYFCQKTNPNMSILLAVKISTSLPIFFEPVEYQNNIYTDGALLCGMPIHILKSIDPLLQKSLGLCVVCERNKGDMSIGNLFEFVEVLMYTLAKHAEKSKLKNKYMDRVITIDTGSINTTDFSITSEDREHLIQLGRDFMSQFLNLSE